MRFKAVAFCLAAFLAVPPGLVVAQTNVPIAVGTGFAQTFRLTENGDGTFSPGKTRVSPIGPADPEPGEITIGLAAAGGAVGVAKLHVYERLSKAVVFKAAAMDRGKIIAVETVCGHLDMDAWVALPPQTMTVVVYQFMEAKAAC